MKLIFNLEALFLEYAYVEAVYSGGIPESLYNHWKNTYEETTIYEHWALKTDTDDLLLPGLIKKL